MDRDELQAQNEEMKGVLAKYAIQLALEIELAVVQEKPDELESFRKCYQEVHEVMPEELPSSPETLVKRLKDFSSTPLGREYFLDTA